MKQEAWNGFAKDADGKPAGHWATQTKRWCSNRSALRVETHEPYRGILWLAVVLSPRADRHYRLREQVETTSARDGAQGEPRC